MTPSASSRLEDVSAAEDGSNHSIPCSDMNQSSISQSCHLTDANHNTYIHIGVSHRRSLWHHSDPVPSLELMARLVLEGVARQDMRIAGHHIRYNFNLQSGRDVTVIIPKQGTGIHCQVLNYSIDRRVHASSRNATARLSTRNEAQH